MNEEKLKNDAKMIADKVLTIINSEKNVSTLSVLMALYTIYYHASSELNDKEKGVVEEMELAIIEAHDAVDGRYK